MDQNIVNYKRGLIDGIPIAIGYFAVSFTIGIAGSNIGLRWYETTLMSALNYTSAGEAAALDIIKEGGSYLVLIASTLIINLRYLLMSAALAVRLSQKTSISKRLLISVAVTDEIFGLASSQKYPLNPSYNLGAMSIACPGWIIGTALGAIVGELLPPVITSSLSLALYAMFIAIIIPPAKENKMIALIVILSMIMSYLFSILPVLQTLSSGIKVIAVTLIISALFSILFPLKDDKEFLKEDL